MKHAGSAWHNHLSGNVCQVILDIVGKFQLQFIEYSWQSSTMFVELLIANMHLAMFVELFYRKLVEFMFFVFKRLFKF